MNTLGIPKGIPRMKECCHGKPHLLVGKIEWWGTRVGTKSVHCVFWRRRESLRCHWLLGCTHCVGKKPGLRPIRFPSDRFFLDERMLMAI